MADKKITALTAGTPVKGDIFPFVASPTTTPVTKSATLQSFVPQTLISRYVSAGNVTTGEDDLYSDTLAASTFTVAGQAIRAFYNGYYIGHATATRQIKAYFGGTLIFDSTALAITANTVWNLELLIIPSSIGGGTARAVASFRYSTSLRAPTETSLTGFTFTNTQILKVTGESAGVGGGASNDVVAWAAHAVLHPAP